ncbi:hypothetical protein LB526_02935 [Mesorhizobium sp. CA6]|uniref:hypothetical protein n=1 Tax=Mesorhizobium sp. CA6 TaxID=588500 RepID=UPI001CCB66D7|nr:hypothetical protein [Mesorhizobium sp. CA6]MBZ9765711.1 hypothetical protein [Mesorhizobium sp. CA6]
MILLATRGRKILEISALDKDRHIGRQAVAIVPAIVGLSKSDGAILALRFPPAL